MENILIIAGEISGDNHAARLVKEMKKINSSFKFFGVGGDNMQAAGVEILFNIRDLAVVGLFEVIKRLPFLRMVRRKLKKEIEIRNVKKVILVDYPGFNLNFAKSIKGLGCNIFYYISPQIWAWGKERIKTIKKHIKKMIVIIPFEEKMYKDFGVPAEFVGHPLLESVNEYNFKSKEEFLKNSGLDSDKKILAIFPGSRIQEIEKILPACISAADYLTKEFNLQAVISAVGNIEPEFYKKFQGTENIKIIYGNNFELLKYSDYGIIKSGTSTLEAALFGLPFVVVYKADPLSYFIGKRFVKIDNIALANIIAGENIINELIQDEANSENIIENIKELISNKDKCLFIKSKLAQVKNKLGEPGASKRAALIISES